MIRFNLIVGFAVAAVGVMSGCTGSPEYKPVETVKKASPLPDHEHGHGEKGPHGGGIVELGEEEYHAEIVVDHDTHAIALYVLGKDAKTAEPVTAAEVTITPEGKDALTLKAVQQRDDMDGKASKFELISDDVVHEVMNAGFLHGELRITIADKPFIGHIDYHLDGALGHDHDEKKTSADATK